MFAAIVAGGLLAAAWAATRPATIRFVAERAIARMIDAPIELGGATHLGRGVLRLHDLRLRAPGWPGAAGETLVIERADVALDISALLLGRVRVASIDVPAARLRIAERESSPGTFSLASFSARGERGAIAALPRASVGMLELELGTVDASGAWRLDGSTSLQGQIEPEPRPEPAPGSRPGRGTPSGTRSGSAPGDWIAFDLRESAEGGLALRGRFDARSQAAQIEIAPIELTPRLRSLCTIGGRPLWDLLDPSGAVDGVTVRWIPGGLPFIEARLRGAELLMPIAVEGQWVRLRKGRMEATSGRPRLRVAEGTLRLDSDALLFDRLRGDLIGTDTDMPLVGVPYVLQLRIGEIAALVDRLRTEPIARALDRVPFELELRLEDFSIAADGPDRDDAVELPWAVADVLEGLGMTRWTISSVLEARRAASSARPAPDPALDGGALPAPVTWSGRAVVSKATMAYEKFAYPLLDTEAFLSFDQGRIVLGNLRGRGPSGGTAIVTGEIARPGHGAGFDLRIIGRDLPLDAALIDVLPPDAAKTVRFLIDESAWAALVRAEVAPDEARHEAWRAERRGLVAGTEGADRRIEALDRMLELGPWTPGGTIDFDFVARRAVGEREMRLAGRIDLDGVVGVCTLFPYPFRVVEGSIEITPEEVTLPETLRIQTAGGGGGRVDGRIGLPEIDGERRIEPALRILVADDRINPALLAAIPSRSAPDGASADDPGDDPAAWIVDASLEGQIGALATISRGDPDRDGIDSIEWNVVLSLSEGTAAPAAVIGRLLGSELDGPSATMPLAGDLEAMIDVDRHRVLVHDLRGRFGEAAVQASIEIELAGRRETRLSTTSVGQPIAPWMLGLAPPRHRDRLASLWERLGPRGTVDLQASGCLAPGLATALRLEVALGRIEGDVDGVPFTAEGRGGTLRADEEGLSFEGLVTALRSGDRDQGTLLFDGGGGSGRLRLRWDEGCFEAPLLAEALRQVGHRRLVEEAGRFSPRGRFDLALETALADPPPLESVELNLRPHRIAIERPRAETEGERAEPAQAPVEIHFEDGALLTMSGGLATLERFVGTTEGGRFEIAGTASLVDDAGADLLLEFAGAGLPREVRALLPPEIVTAMDEIELSLRGPTTALGRLRLEPPATESALREGGGWLATFDGVVGITDASLVAGIDVAGLKGEVGLRARGGGGLAPVVEIEPRLSRAILLGRPLTDLRGRVVIDRPAGEARLETLVAHAALGAADPARPGVLLARGVVGLDPASPYWIALEGVDVPLAAIAARSDASDSGAEEPGVAGRLVGRLELDGVRGSSSSRRGRGAVEIRDARMGATPLALGLLQLSQFMLPINDALSRADATFYVVGDTLVFERLDLTCDTLRLVGAGTLDLPSMTLATRFSPGGSLPIVSDLVRSVSDQIYAIELVGPVAAPKTGIVPLPTLGTLLPRPAPSGAPPAAAADAPPPLLPRTAPRRTEVRGVSRRSSPTSVPAP
ncbi:MAG TPA: hypothetical protein PKC43_06930 [Phycisphaerales bacterium]|nr:hypothetical protein [Phycisphaerales bacterium]HMP37167.1 hypothetical protein [Phycisphaerales bacterium]